MYKYNNVTKTIKNNRNIILISFCTSIFTMLVLVSVFILLLNTKVISLNNDSIRVGSANQIGKPIPTGTAAEESSVINTVEKANPAVVSIVITKDIPTIEQYYRQYYPFSNLGGDTSKNSTDSTEKQEIGGGSGFFVSSDGYIVTNNHVVSDESASYTVVTSDGSKYTAKVLAKDSTLDVAVLKIDGKNFSYLSFANSDDIKLGQTAIAIGNALAEFQNSISMGIVSGIDRSVSVSDSSTGISEQLDQVIQTDAAINPGNSGGPLLDIKGNVIGVNVAVEYNAQNIGFALPSNMVKNIAESVMNNGEIIKPYLGVRYTQITEALKKKNDLSVDYGALVSKGETSEDLAVIPGSPADKAGIVENDIILEVDGTKLDETKPLATIIRQKQVGQTITLKVIHDGDTKEVKATLEKAPTK